MTRRLIAFVVSLVLAFSGFSAAARALAPAWVGDEPVMVHVASGSPHHQDGGESASAQLECCDGVSDAALLAPAWPLFLGQFPSAMPAERPAPALTTPFLEGPKRPPRG